VTLNSAESVTAVFGPLRIALHLRVVGKGRIVCAPICAKTIRAGNPLALRAVPAKGWRFTGWTGGCQGKQAACAPKTDFSLSIRASFKRRSH
jgi:hypothetical protein